MELIGWMGSIDRFDRWNRSIGSIGILDVIDRIDRIIRSMDARIDPIIRSMDVPIDRIIRSMDVPIDPIIRSMDARIDRIIRSIDARTDRCHHSIDPCTDGYVSSVRIKGTHIRDTDPIDPSTDRPIDRPRRPTPSTMDDSLQFRRCIAIITITTIRTRRRVSTPARTFPVDRIDRTHFLTPSPRHHARRRASDRAVRRAALTARDSSESSRIATHSFEIRRRRAGETGDERGFVQG